MAVFETPILLQSDSANLSLASVVPLDFVNLTLQILAEAGLEHKHCFCITGGIYPLNPLMGIEINKFMAWLRKRREPRVLPIRKFRELMKEPEIRRFFDSPMNWMSQ